MLERRDVMKAILAGGVAGLLRPAVHCAAAQPAAKYESAETASFEGRGHDDTARLSSAFHWLAGAPQRSLVFERRQYVISSRIDLIGAHAFRVEGNDATISAANGMPVKSEYQLLRFVECSDGEIADFRVDGNRLGRQPAEVPAHSVQIFTGCARLTFSRVQSDNAVVDAFYVNTRLPRVLSSVPTDIKFRDCGARNAFRNNLSVINSNRFRDHGGVYDGANGTLPMAGIDFEPNDSADIGNLDAQCFGTRCDGNRGAGFQLIGRNTSAILHDVTSSGNSYGAVVGDWGSLRIEGITIENYGPSIRRGIIDAYYMSGETHIRHVRARNCNPGSNAKPLIFIHRTSTGPITIDDVTTVNSTRAITGGSAKVRVTGLRLGTPAL